MIVGTIKLEDSEIAVGEVPLTFVDDEERWLLQGQASCTVRNSNVLIALPQEKTTISGCEGSQYSVVIRTQNTVRKRTPRYNHFRR